MSTVILCPMGVSCERSEPEDLRAGRALAPKQPHDGPFRGLAQTLAHTVKSFLGFMFLIEPYGRGKGLSIAALFNNMPSQHVFPHSLYLETTLDHLGCHLGANRGPFRVQHGPGNGWGGGRRG
ncbi:hypothetical protein AQ436_10580 [Arthrobacter sp. EpRS66]|nr:hypothetical protein AQ436_10580 [Arthrobacter sp. EpRS66]